MIGNSHASTQIFEVGKVELKLKFRNTLPLEKVFYVPKIRRNLISESLRNGAGYTFYFSPIKLL